MPAFVPDLCVDSRLIGDHSGYMIATITKPKAMLSALVARAESGEDVVITVHGEPRARLTAIHTDDRASRNRWVKALRQLQRKHGTGGRTRRADEIVRELREDRT